MAWLDLTVVVLMKVAGYSNAAVWCVTWGLGSVVYYLGCSTFVAFGERRIVIRYYGTQVVMGVACCCAGVARCVSNQTHLATPAQQRRWLWVWLHLHSEPP